MERRKRTGTTALRDHRRRWRCLVVALLLTILAIPAAAQQDPKSLLKEGNRLFNGGDYPAAVQAYEKGYKAQPTPVFLRNMGYCRLKMMQHAKAAKIFEKYLLNFPSAADRTKVKNIVRGLAEVMNTRVEVRSNPSEAEVYIDTEAGGKVGFTPFKGSVPPGHHKIIVKAKGYRTAVREFSIKKNGKESFFVQLGISLTVDSTPKGATILLDSLKSKPVGKTPLTLAVDPGKRVVFLQAPGYLTYRQQLEASPGRKLVVDAKLNLGVQVTSIPAGASVAVDGTAIPGKTPLEVGATAGKHQVTVRYPGFKPMSREVTVAPGQDNLIRMVLSGSLLTLSSDPRGAKVVVETMIAGHTPLDRVAVPMGTRTVKVTARGHRSWSGPMDFKEGQALSAEVKLGRPLWPVWVTGGLAVAGIVAGSVTGLMAKSQIEKGQSESLCDATGQAINHGTSADCGFALHHASTATFSIAGISAAVGLVYYFLVGRNKVKVSHQVLERKATRAQ